MSEKELDNFLENIPSDIEKEKIVELPIGHIKGLSKETEKTLKNILNINTIAEFAQKILTHTNIHLLKVLGIDEATLETFQAVANYIFKLVRGTVDLNLSMKILLAGLDNAGKTAILNIITKRFNITNLKPTKEAVIEKMESKDVTFVIWDMGGQERYRRNYIENPDRYFVDVQSFIYVIDVQDKKNYELSKEYLSKIVSILESFNEFPEFFVFLHKADPEIYDKIQPDLKDCEEIIKNIFEDRAFQYRIFHTSVYNTALTGGNFADSLANLFELEVHEDTSSAELLNSLQLVYNNFIRFSYVLETFEKRLSNIEAHISGGKAIELPTAPTTKAALITKLEKPALPPRQALVSELKQLFRKTRASDA